MDEPGIDPNIQDLVRVLNRFPGIRTTGSCGGHEDAGPGQWAAGSWFVTFEVAHTDAGWLALEFLAWAVNTMGRDLRKHALLLPTAPPPYLNRPGRCLRFALEGREGEDPVALAGWLDGVTGQVFTGPPSLVARVRAWWAVDVADRLRDR